MQENAERGNLNVSGKKIIPMLETMKGMSISTGIKKGVKNEYQAYPHYLYVCLVCLRLME